MSEIPDTELALPLWNVRRRAAGAGCANERRCAQDLVADPMIV